MSMDACCTLGGDVTLAQVRTDLLPKRGSVCAFAAFAQAASINTPSNPVAARDICVASDPGFWKLLIDVFMTHLLSWVGFEARTQVPSVAGAGPGTTVPA
jgi:hypothetical protein